MRRTLFIALSVVSLLATGVVAGLAAGGTGTVDPPPRIAFLANGIVPADALAAGGIAGQLGAPLYTTRADSLNDDARDGIKAYDPDLVIVLGGPVAINESVVDALATATGLAKTTATNPTDGIVRAAGGDRFATARAVADLLAAYNPAYLPVDATALGAVDADTAATAGDSDLLDGLDSTDFALSDQACAPGEVVTGIDPAGAALCESSDHVHLADSDSPYQVPSEDFGFRAFASFGETVEVLTVGAISVDLECRQDVSGENDQVRLLARTSVDGAFMDADSNHTGPGNGSDYLDVDTEADARQISDGLTSVPDEPALEFDIDTAYVAGRDGEYIGIDETLAFGVNVYGHDCYATGVLNIIRA